MGGVNHPLFLFFETYLYYMLYTYFNNFQNKNKTIMKFLQSVYFNVLLAVVAAVLGIMQEVWIGTSMTFLSSFALGGAIGIGFSLIAETAKIIFFNGGVQRKFNTKEVLIGCGFGVAAALITVLLVL